MAVKLIYWREQIHLYWSQGGDSIRHRTGVKVDEAYLTKDNFVNSKHPDHLQINFELKRMVRELDLVILAQGIKPDIKVVKQILKEKETPNTLINLWTQWIDGKKSEMKPSSWKTYKNFGQQLMDWLENSSKPNITFDEIDEDWMRQFRNFMTRDRTKDPNSQTPGKLNNNTVFRRFKTFKSFYRWAKLKDYCKENHAIYNFKTDQYKNPTIWIDEELLVALKNHQADDPYYDMVKDIFLILCYTALRWGDFQQLNADIHFQQRKGRLHIVKETQKTGTPIIQPIHTAVIEILEKWNWELPKVWAHDFNPALKRLCSEIPEFHRKKQIRHKYGNIIEEKIVPMYELMTSHVGRHTAATRWVLHRVPDNAIMQWAGWADNSMIVYYADVLGIDSTIYMDDIP